MREYGVSEREPSLGDTFSLGTLGGSTKQQKGKPDRSRAAPKGASFVFPWLWALLFFPQRVFHSPPVLGHHLELLSEPLK